jgi:N-acetylmuramoyl-L-alanine amidase
MPVHVVKQGDCLSSIADQYGFFWDTLWNHERNAELREHRKNPNVLMTGDHVFIPEKRQKMESGETGRVHTFRLKGVPVRLNLQLLDFQGQPRAGIKYTLTIDGKTTRGVVPDDGVIREIIPPRASKGTLRLETDEEFELQLGHMNPIEYTSGVQARLANRGYYRGEISGTLDEETRDALRRFQADRGLAVTGEVDSETKAALLAAHEG